MHLFTFASVHALSFYLFNQQNGFYIHLTLMTYCISNNDIFLIYIYIFQMTNRLLVAALYFLLLKYGLCGDCPDGKGSVGATVVSSHYSDSPLTDRQEKLAGQ